MARTQRGESGQCGIAEAFLGAGIGGNAKLDAITAQIDLQPVATLINLLHPGRTGRPPRAPPVMVRVLLLLQWYGLSDVEMCEALADRFSFRRFWERALDEPTPDTTTLSRIRAALRVALLTQPIIEEVNRQLDAHGLMLSTTVAFRREF